MLRHVSTINVPNHLEPRTLAREVDVLSTTLHHLLNATSTIHLAHCESGPLIFNLLCVNNLSNMCSRFEECIPVLVLKSSKEWTDH